MSESWRDGELLAFDLETTGVNKHEDVPVSFALITMKGGSVVQARECLVNPGRPIPPGASNVHGISTERAMAEGIAMPDAVEEIIAALLDASQRGVPVVGFNISYDLTMMDARVRALKGTGLQSLGWSGPVMDGLVIDRALDKYRKGKRTLGLVCEHYGITNEAAHDATGDATASAMVVLALAEKFPEIAASDASSLTEQQVQWHREWASGFDEYQRSNGRRGLEPDDFLWPISLVADEGTS